MRRVQLPAWALLGFAGAGLAGGWSLLPPALFYLTIVLLPGHVVLSAAGLDDEPLAAGPPRLVLDLCASLVALVPPVLVLLPAGRPLSSAWVTLGSWTAALALAALWRRRRPSPVNAAGWGDWKKWACFGLALAVLLPAVWTYAGGTVDDWWDLAFVRSYAERDSFSLNEPVLGSGAVHPRFAWNSWLVAQALALALCGGDPAALQSRVVAPLVCVLVVAAFALLARVFLAERGRLTECAAVAMVPVWLYGTEALPFFTRLHQDKFVAGLVLVPAMLAWAAAAATDEDETLRPLVALALAALACAVVHGLMLAVGLIGVGTVVSAALAGASAGGRRRLAAVVSVGAIAALYPAWQAFEVGRWFAAEGISMAATDNPVVRAHLALGRLWAPQSAAYVVRPSAVFGPVAVLAVPALWGLWRRRAQRRERMLLLLAVVPCLLVFVPGLAAAVGRLLVPWMLYRVAWLVPVPLLLAVSVDTLWGRRAYGPGVLAALLALATAAASAQTGIARWRRNMQPHPVERERAPSGSTLRLYEALRQRREPGPVLAPPGVAHLLPALGAHSVVASTERATLVFSGDEAEAYRRLADRARFYSPRSSAAEREAIARRYGVRLVVFERRLIPEGGERAWLATASPEAFVRWVEGGGLATPFATREALLAAIPPGWSVVWESPDYFLVATGVASAASQPRQNAGGWTAAFSLTGFDPPPEGEVLASASAYPGAVYRFEPVPATLATPHGIAWTSGGRLWYDGPQAVTIDVDLERACRVTGVELVPSIRTGRREVLAVTVRGRRRSGIVRDREPVFVRLDGSMVERVSLDVESLMGVAFALEDVRVWGDRAACRGSWSPRVKPLWPQGELGVARLIDLVRSYPRQAKASVALARVLERFDRRDDAREVLRLALARQDDRPVPWIEAGLLDDAEGRSDEALSAYRRALSADSNNIWARGCLAWALVRRGHVLGGLWYAWRARAAEPRYADAYTIEALAVERLGLVRMAERRLRRAVELDPKRGWGVMELAKLLARNGRRGEALRLIAEYLEHVPDDASAHKLARRLGGETGDSS